MKMNREYLQDVRECHGERIFEILAWCKHVWRVITYRRRPALSDLPRNRQHIVTIELWSPSGRFHSELNAVWCPCRAAHDVGLCLMENAVMRMADYWGCDFRQIDAKYRVSRIWC